MSDLYTVGLWKLTAERSREELDVTDRQIPDLPDGPKRAGLRRRADALRYRLWHLGRTDLLTESELRARRAMLQHEIAAYRDPHRGRISGGDQVAIDSAQQAIARIDAVLAKRAEAAA